MARTSFCVAALVAAVLVIACSDARADTGAGASDPPQATAVEGTAVQGIASEDGSPGGGGVTTSSEGGVLSVTQDAGTLQQTPPAQEEVQPSQSPTPPPQSTPASGQESAPTAPPPQGGTAASPPQRLKETPPATSAQPADQASAFTAAASSNDSPTVQAPEPVATPPVPPAPPRGSGALSEVSPSNAGTQPGEGLEQLLSEVGRRLHNVQGKIDDLRHHIAQGAPPPKSRLIDLRSSLGRIAPMLAALEASLDAAGRLSPHLRQILHRVEGNLHGVRVTAAGLITALRHSGARGPEVRLLLRELEQFRTLDLAVPSSPAAAPAPASPSAGANVGYVALEPVQAASPPPASVSSPPRGAAGPQPTRSRGGRGSEEPPPPTPWSPVPGSATASPGGAFFFAAVASLTMLLIGLLLPALRARLDLPPGRRYQVAFLAPLERPG
jgi:hypothetical protein